MKKLFYVISLFILFKGIAFSQPILNGSTTLPGTGNQIVKINSSTYDYGTYAIGKEVVGTDTKIYRTYFEFSLNAIPTNATISSATVSYFNGTISYTLKLTLVSTVSPTDKSANWSAIGNSSSLHTGLPYSGSNFSSTPIKTAIQNALASRKLIIGALSESESTNGSYTSMSMNIDVNYTYPAATLSLQARNDLEGNDGGNIGVGVYPSSASSQSSPFTFSAYETQRVNLAAYDNQSWGGSTWVFNDNEAQLNKSKWDKYKNNVYTYISASSSVTSPQLLATDGNSTFIAYLKKYCSATFQNNFGGGTIIIDGTSRNSGYSQQVIKLNNITATATRQYNIGGLDYIFTQWGDGNTTSSRTFNIANTQTYTANYTPIPSNINENLYFGSTLNQPITLHWTDNVNTNVTSYQIWRQVKINGVWQSPSQIGTVNRGVQQYTDYTYLLGQWKQGTEIQYDVRGYYSVNGSYQDPYWSTVYGIDYKIVQDNEKQLASLGSEIPSGYSINNYPNPFNPATVIKYELPENGYVTIKVYDVLGKEVTTLVNENKQAGYHSVNFDASKLTSGIYIYMIQTENFTQSKKMLMLK